jgi:hypothetical protein
MPKKGDPLTPEQIGILRAWIDQGADFPDEASVTIEDKRDHWSFQSPVQAPLPQNGESHPIDAFIKDRLAREGLDFSPAAAPTTLLRRIHLDLTGLPPTIEEQRVFEAESIRNPHPAFRNSADRLLASPHHGERWGRHWLDAARYADSDGYEKDKPRINHFYRDWVIGAINRDLPYDQFIIEQIAGDLLPNATQEQKLATGFNRNHMINGEGGRIAEETRVENVMDRVETTSTVWLGLTMGCSKCHDHKFDPLTMRDYYALYDVFNQTSEDGKGRSGQAAPAMDISTPAELERVKKTSARVELIAKEVETFELTKFPRAAGKPLTESDAIKLPGNLPSYIAKTEPKNRGVDPLLEAVSYFKEKDAAYTKLLQKLLAAVRERVSASNNVTKVMVMDTLPQPRETYTFEKGAYDKPTTTKVSFSVPASLPPMAKDAPKNRLGLAQWIVSRDNPLTARVTVNRFWQAFFGVGLVKTAEDFGVQGEVPLHRELLDWLAAEFIESGWDVKALMRLIVTSETYRQSSKFNVSSFKAAEIDPENRYLARGPRFRMPSWMIRDQALFVSGLMKEQLGGPSVKPYQPEGIWEEATFGKKSYVQDHGDALYRRTLYTFWRRIVGPTMLFDNAARQVCAVKTTRTNTPLQALVTLNDITYVEAARALAQRVLVANRGNEDAALEQAFRWVTCRAPSGAEKALLKQQLGQLRAQQGADRAAASKLLTVGESKRDESLDPAEHAVWTSLCLMLLNLDETVTKE